jgi:hypothetical protein
MSRNLTPLRKLPGAFASRAASGTGHVHTGMNPVARADAVARSRPFSPNNHPAPLNPKETTMTTFYHHTQRGLLMSVGFLVAASIIAPIAYLIPSPAGKAIMTICAIVFVTLAWLFSSLTVEVAENEIRWRFGHGSWTYRIALADVKDVQTVRNSLTLAYGIKVWFAFRSYSVAGLDAVELRLKSGAVRRIGTDDPNGLAAALKTQLMSR